jgi:hypothetical protein
MNTTTNDVPIHQQIKLYLTPRIKQLESISSNTRSYFALIKTIVEGSDPEFYKEITSVLDTLRTIGESLTQLDTPPSNLPLTLANIYDIIENAVKLGFTAIYKLLTNESYVRYAREGQSAVQAFETRHQATAIKKQLSNYDIIIAEDDVKIIELINNALVNNEIINNALANNAELKEFIATLAITYPSPNRFVIGMMRLAMTFVSDERKRTLSVIIDNLKNTVLEIPNFRHLAVSHICPITRGGLIPATEPMTIVDLFKLIPGAPEYDPKSDLDDNMRVFTNVISKISTDGGGPVIGCMLWRHADGSPLIFDLRGLLSADYIKENELDISLKTGLTKKFITKYTTVNTVQRGDWGNDLRSIIRYIPEKKLKAEFYWVIETIDLLTYRILVVGKTDVPNTVHEITTVPYPRTLFLDTNGNMRPHQYNLILSKIIIERGYSTNVLRLVENYQNSLEKNYSTEGIKQKVVDALTMWFRPIAQKLTSAAELTAAVINPDILVSILMKTLTHRIGTPEYMLSYVNKMEKIASQMNRELERLWHAEKITERMFHEHTRRDMEVIIMTAYVNNAKRAADNLDAGRVWVEYDRMLKEFVAPSK